MNAETLEKIGRLSEEVIAANRQLLIVRERLHEVKKRLADIEAEQHDCIVNLEYAQRALAGYLSELADAE